MDVPKSKSEVQDERVKNLGFMPKCWYDTFTKCGPFLWYIDQENNGRKSELFFYHICLQTIIFYYLAICLEAVWGQKWIITTCVSQRIEIVKEKWINLLDFFLLIFNCTFNQKFCFTYMYYFTFTRYFMLFFYFFMYSRVRNSRGVPNKNVGGKFPTYFIT